MYVPVREVTVRIPVRVYIGADDTAEARDFGPLFPRMPMDDGSWWYTVYIHGGGHFRSFGVINFPTHRDTDREDDTFTVELGPLPPGFRMGEPSRVTVTIEDAERGAPDYRKPVVRLTVGSSL